MSYNVKSMIRATFCIFITTISFSAFSEILGCIKYQRADYSWSHNYKVRGEIYSGTDLQLATRSIHYKVSSYYFYVPFDNGGYITLEIPYYDSSLPYFEATTKDQRGGTWKMKSGWNYCY